MNRILTGVGSHRTLAATLMFAGSLLFQLGGSVSTAKAEDPFKGFPIAVACENDGTIRAFFLSRITEDGTATYVASEGIGGTITLKGQAKAVASRGDGNCVGKTLQELRASGQALYAKP